MSEISNIPQDMIIDILYRLPAKSLARFRCVSKSWLSVLTHTKFIKTHFNKNIRNHNILAIFPEYSLHVLTLTPQNDYVSTQLNFPSDLDRNWFKIVGSCGGLVLALDRDEYPKGLFLINPTSSKYKKLPQIPLDLDDEASSYIYGFGYDVYSDDFKIVSIWCYNFDLINVYSLKKNCWRKIDFDYSTCVNAFDFGDSICANASSVLLHGAIHWLVYRRADSTSVIAAFDLSTEKFRGVEVPNDTGDARSWFTTLGVIDCCLCMIINNYPSWIDVWMMKEYGVQGSWIKLIKISNGFDIVIPVSLGGDLELFVSNLDNLQPEIFNVKDRRFRSFIVDGERSLFRNAWAFTESLVSPNANR